MSRYDYIIIGGGSAGCVLANRLSANPHNSVCLLEAGPADSNPFIRIPIGILYMMLSKTLNWRYFTEPQPCLKQRRLFWPRGKTLGGSSASNAMIYTRGHPHDYDHWAALGNAGWSYAELLPYFKCAEHNEAGGNAFHGTDGPLNVSALRTPNILSRIFEEAANEAGYASNNDFNGARQEGVGAYQVTQKNGERWSVAHAYLHPARHRSNLTVLTNVRVSKILLAGKRASGIAYFKSGKQHELSVRREVLLCGGAINSPQILMLSGIGPEAELAKFNIPLLHGLPGVGKNLQDHLDVLLLTQCKKPVSLGITPATLLQQVKHVFDYFYSKTGPLTTNSTEAGGFIKSDAAQAIPDLQLHFTPARLDEHGHTLSRAAYTLLGHGYALHVCNLRPKSRGYIGLKSADPLADALIEPNYLSHPDDMAVMLQGIKSARNILAAKAFDPYRGVEIFPGNAVQTDLQIQEFVRQKAASIYHPVGSCKMGNDALAVVDQHLMVHGMQGLRVVDASIMPTLIGGNTNAPVVMIAEKAAEMILQSQEQE